jgi:hypothetical protein
MRCAPLRDGSAIGDRAVELETDWTKPVVPPELRALNAAGQPAGAGSSPARRAIWGLHRARFEDRLLSRAGYHCLAPARCRSDVLRCSEPAGRLCGARDAANHHHHVSEALRALARRGSDQSLVTIVVVDRADRSSVPVLEFTDWAFGPVPSCSAADHRARAANRGCPIRTVDRPLSVGDLNLAVIARIDGDRGCGPECGIVVRA